LLIISSFLIAPYITEPIAATVAGELPLIAAKIIDAKIAAIGRPPGRCPTKLFAKLIILVQTEPLESKEPAKINIGIAISVYLFNPSKIMMKFPLNPCL
jgi:hypothetical protein